MHAHAQESNPDDAGLTPEQLEERVREKAALKEAKAKIAAEKLAAKEIKKKLRCAPLPLYFCPWSLPPSVAYMMCCIIG